MTSIKNIFIVLVILDLALIGFSLYKGGRWLINSQLAFISSFLVTVASYFSYKRLIDKRVRLKMESFDDRSELDKIEDPYELYDEDEINQTPIEDLDVKQIIKDEKKKIKIINPKSLKYGIKGGFSLLRLGGYLFLIAGFIALKNNHLLDLKIYLPSILIGIVLGNMIYTKKGDL